MLGIPIEVWYHNVFPYLPLDELVFLQRTCCAFGFDGALRKVIAACIKVAFAGYDRVYWNRMSAIDANHVFQARIVVCTITYPNGTKREIHRYAGPCGIFISTYDRTLRTRLCVFALYSSTDRLRDAYSQWQNDSEYTYLMDQVTEYRHRTTKHCQYSGFAESIAHVFGI